MKKKILVADDDPAILEACALLLEDAGYEVLTAVDGTTVRTIQENFPDLILLDLWMSGISGEEICRYLKQQEKTKHIPIIIFSASRETKDIAKKVGADDFIEKPFQMEELLAKIENLLK